ncbi:MAG: acyltransferase [Clostridiales bacterium]|nr:acyltransferase [Clostridiales bacterium]
MALKQERNYGIDLLRMVAMFMVTVLHVLGQGGVLGNTYGFSGQYLVSWFLELAAYGAVNLYALISGYVGIDSKYRASNFIVLWLQVVLYSLGISVIAALFQPEVCGIEDIIGSAFPILTGQYWYFSAYFCLFLFMPLLNAAINTMSKRSLKWIMIALVVVFSLLASVAREAKNDPFCLVGGYSGLWLIVLYAVGAYIKKYGLGEKCSQVVLFLIFLGSVVLSLALKYAIQYFSQKINGSIYSPRFVASFLSPLILLASVSLLLFFSRLRCGKAAKKLIAFFAPAAFGVYIIHVHPLIWESLIKNRFVSYASLSPLALAGAVLLTAFGIYLVCSLIDLLRIRIFKLLKIRKRCMALEEKIFKEKIGSRE